MFLRVQINLVRYLFTYGGPITTVSFRQKSFKFLGFSTHTMVFSVSPVPFSVSKILMTLESHWHVYGLRCRRLFVIAIVLELLLYLKWFYQVSLVISLFVLLVLLLLLFFIGTYVLFLITGLDNVMHGFNKPKVIF